MQQAQPKNFKKEVVSGSDKRYEKTKQGSGMEREGHLRVGSWEGTPQETTVLKPE